MSPRSLQVRAHKIKYQRQLQAEETHLYTNIRRLKPLLNRRDVDYGTDTNDFSITRILDHKQTMLGQGRWKMNKVKKADSCWVCNNWVYTLYFWNERIG